MDPRVSGTMMRAKQRRITREMAKKMRKTFPFMQLPAELRFMIYKLTLDTNGIQNCIAKYYEKVKDTSDIKKVLAPLVHKKPSILFRICKQIYLESVPLLSKQAVTLDHGLLDLAQIEDFACPNFFRTLSSITINDKGHPLFKSNISSISWLGYTTLIEQVAKILVPGHNLKEFTISFEDPGIHQHVTYCWDSTLHCGFRDTLKTALEPLQSVRNVGKVTLHGLPPALAKQLKARMEYTPVTFFHLPNKIRDKIYGMCADWSDVSTQLVHSMKVWPDDAAIPKAPSLKTPNVLLLNRQITFEAQQVLRAKPLVLDLPRFVPSANRVFNVDHIGKVSIKEFISYPTIANIKHLVLKIENWLWLYILRKFIKALVPSASDQPNGLQTLSIHLTDLYKPVWANAPEGYPDLALRHDLQPFEKLRNLKDVAFTGDLPACYTVPLTIIMQSPTHTPIWVLPRLKAVTIDNQTALIDKDEDDEQRAITNQQRIYNEQKW